MERKYLIVIIVLAISLAAGCLALVLRRGGVSAGLARVFSPDQGWIEVKPRVSGTSANNNANAAKKGSDPVSQSATSPTSVITWCDITAAGQPKREVILSEIAWMGAAASYSDEWIELKNISNSSVSLDGWQLQNKSKKIKISFAAADSIESAGFFLLERTADDSVPAVLANKIYSGTLANSKEALYLFDNNCQLQDSAIAAKNWPAGSNVTKQTMERAPNLAWRSSAHAGGTPGSENIK